jgi:hypothetical protein
MDKLFSLCRSVGRTPGLGYCHEGPQGFYGVMMETMGPLPDKASQGEGSEVYGWYAVRCGPSPPNTPVDECLGKYQSCKDWAVSQLRGCIDLCELKRADRAESPVAEVPLISCTRECRPKHEKDLAMCDGETRACLERAGRE